MPIETSLWKTNIYDFKNIKNIKNIVNLKNLQGADGPNSEIPLTFSKISRLFQNSLTFPVFPGFPEKWDPC